MPSRFSSASAPAEYVLDESTEALFRELVQGILEQRHPGGSPTNLFFRLAPERWLETLITREVRVIDERLDGRFVYSQVPAFAASDRAMLDVLTCTLDGRLAILELKANEDIHLPLQGLDYWARVRWHQQHGEFARNGYFAGRELSSAPPLLFLVAPALRVHPASDVLLRYLSPRIEWTLVQMDERWRNGVRVVNKKHPKKNVERADFTDRADSFQIGATKWSLDTQCKFESQALCNHSRDNRRFLRRIQRAGAWVSRVGLSRGDDDRSTFKRPLGGA